MDVLRDDRTLLTEVLREVGEIALTHLRDGVSSWNKDDGTPVSDADLAVNRHLQERLSGARPDYGWLSEETADDEARLSRERVFVVDPIDGTRGFLEGLRSWCVSVAVVEDGRTLAGVLECPAMEETYWALPGEGAFLNGRPIAARRPAATVDIGGPKPLIDLMPAEWLGRLNRVSYIPSLAYRLAMVANGALDATFVKPNAHDWDIAAADLILHEAGGALLDQNGRAPRYAGEVIRHGALVAGSGELLAVLSGVIAGLDN
jgi:myo-inositol-1(or 4)-monophosphatase